MGKGLSKGGDGETTYDPALHPLGNQVVLRHFFQLCPPGVLANCRLVCKSWNELSLPSWRRMITPRLTHEEDGDGVFINLTYSDEDFSPTPLISPKEGPIQHHEGENDPEEEEMDPADEEAEISDEELDQDDDEDYEAEDEIELDEDEVELDEDEDNPDSSEDEEEEEGQVSTELGVRNSIQEFLDFAGSAESQYLRAPFRRFALKIWNFHDKRLDSFWNAVGGHITRLFLYRCTFPGPDAFRQLIFTACPHLHILSVLSCHYDAVDLGELEDGLRYREPAHGPHMNLRKVKVQSYSSADHVPLIPISWLELFSHFQEVDELRICYPNNDRSNTAEVQKALQAINTIRDHDPSKLQIRSLETEFIVVSNETRELLPLFKKLRIPLEFLNLQVEPDVEGELMKSVLEACSKYIGGISIKGINGPIVPIELGSDSKWDYLRVMVLSGKLCQNLEFLLFTPNLSILRVSDYTIVWGDEPQFRESTIVRHTSKDRMSRGRLPNVITFRFEYLLSEEDLRSLVGWMPNVVCGSLILDDNLFPIVCEHWRKLTHFQVNGDSMTDEGVTGRLRTGLQLMRKYNITNLQALEHVLFDYVKLTEYSVIHGFAKLPKLNFLEVHDTSELGEKGLKALSANQVRVKFWPDGNFAN